MLLGDHCPLGGWRGGSADSVKMLGHSRMALGKKPVGQNARSIVPTPIAWAMATVIALGGLFLIVKTDACHGNFKAAIGGDNFFSFNCDQPAPPKLPEPPPEPLPPADSQALEITTEQAAGTSVIAGCNETIRDRVYRVVVQGGKRPRLSISVTKSSTPNAPTGLDISSRTMKSLPTYVLRLGPNLPDPPAQLVLRAADGASPVKTYVLEEWLGQLNCTSGNKTIVTPKVLVDWNPG
jgi:hypothetical protein